MNRSTPLLALAAGLALALSMPAGAASSAASSASDSLTTSSGSVSGSLQNSSGSSSRTNNVAEGDYKIIEAAVAPQRPGDVRLTLQRSAEANAEAKDDDAIFLTVPQAVYVRSGLAQGGVLNARHRPYGLEFLAGKTREAFFLVLEDDWVRELKTVPVSG